MKDSLAPPAFGQRLVGAMPNGLTALASTNELTVKRGSVIVERLAAGHDIPGTRIQTLFADREGSLWIGTNGGLARLAGGKLQLFPVTDPLASASVLAVMEDHEGNLWVGTETDGLHISARPALSYHRRSGGPLQ